MPKTDWITDVRSLLRREHGKGWRIEEQSGRVKLCLAVPGQRKQAVTTHLSWAPSSATKLATLLPNGTVLEAPDPSRVNQGLLESRFVLEGEATVSPSGVVMAGTKLKIGSPVELEGPLYRVNGTVSGVEVKR